jgi:indole-3-glycerol phosphate synthase
VVGVFSERFVPLVASALHQLGTRHALVVHGGGLDEISVCGPTAAVEVTPSGLTPLTLEPNEWGIERHPLEALQGGDAATNAGLLNGILDGAPGARRDAVLVNAGAAIYVGGAVETIGDGVELARRTIDSGGARAHFDRFLRAQSETTILDDIVSRLPRLKSLGPVPAVSRPSTLRSLREALSAGEAPRIIAEVKRKSPGAGAIADIPDPAALARSYVSRGARAISVLTNGADFGGSLEDLRLVRRAVELPVLRKEFIVDVRQLDEAVEAGADAVLLIVALLGRGLARMHDAARRRGLECLVEVHDEAELEQALHAGVEMVGINNRNLKTMQVDLSVCERLARLVPSGQVVVAESGIHSQTALARLRNSGLENFLVGEFLVRGGAW